MTERDDNILYGISGEEGGLREPLSTYAPSAYAPPAGKLKPLSTYAHFAYTLSAKEQNDMRAQNSRQQKSELISYLWKQRQQLIYRANQARRLIRRFSTTIMKDRVMLYADFLENTASEITVTLPSQNTLEQSGTVGYLTEEERKEDRRALVNAILEDALFFLSKAGHCEQTMVQGIVDDCCNLLKKRVDSHQEPSRELLQKYCIQYLQVETDDACCPVCGQHYLNGLLFCLNCGVRKTVPANTPPVSMPEKMPSQKKKKKQKKQKAIQTTKYICTRCGKKFKADSYSTEKHEPKSAICPSCRKKKDARYIGLEAILKKVEDRHTCADTRMGTSQKTRRKATPH